MTLLDIAARLEAAEGPSRELDVEIALAVDWSHPSMGCSLRNLHSIGESIGAIAQDANGTGSILKDLPRYTGSIDAALTLVPEGLSVTLLANLLGGKGIASLGTEKGSIGDINGYKAATPALALVSAALRARDAALART